MDHDIIRDAVEGALHQMAQYAPEEYSAMRDDPMIEESIREAARAAAAEEVRLAHEFAIRPGQDIRKRLAKHLPEDGIKLIEEALTIPTFNMEITQNSVGTHFVQLTREGEEFLPGRELSAGYRGQYDDINWAKIMQYASIVVEAVMLALQAVGVKASVSSSTTKATIEETAQTIEKSSVFQKAIQAFISSWKKAGSSSMSKAKAIFYLLKDTMAAGILWTIIKSLFKNMSWWEWTKTAAMVSAMIIASLATEGAALIAKIALALVAAAGLAKKIANVVKLEEIEESM